MAYLSSLLGVSLRKKSSELEEKREELRELQEFTADIIHSMRGGLVTTDLEGACGAAESHRAKKFWAVFRGDAWHANLREVSPDFWLSDMSSSPERLSLRREIEMRTPGGQRRYLGISVSPLRTREASAVGTSSISRI